MIAMHQAGMESAVATCGAALGEDHLELLGRLGQQIVLAFDADRPVEGTVVRGEKASRRSGRRLDLRVARLTGGKGPSDLLQAGRAGELRRAVDEARPALLFRMDHRLERANLADPEARARAVKELAVLIATVGDSIVRAEYEQTLSRRTGMGIAEIKAVVSRGRSGRSEPDRQQQGQVSGVPVERELLRAVILNHPTLRQLDIDSSLFGDGVYRRAFERIETDWRDTPPERPTPIVLRNSDNGGSAPEDIALLELSDDQSAPGDPHAMVIRCKWAALGRQRDAVAARMRTLPPDDPRRSRLLHEIARLDRRRQELVTSLP